MSLVAWYIWSSKTVLYQDRVVQYRFFSQCEILRRDLLGYRTPVLRTQYGPIKSVDLLPKNDQLRKLSIPGTFASDAQFIAWLEGIPNLDAEETQAAEREIEQDASLGNTPSERKARAQSLTQWGGRIGVGYLAANLVIGFYPHPVALALIIPLIGPWIAIAMVALRGDDFTILENGRAISMKKGNLLPLLASPLAALFAIFRVQADGPTQLPINVGPIAEAAMVGGMVMTFLVWVVSRNQNITLRSWLASFFVLTIYSAGILGLENGLFDHGFVNDYVLHVDREYQTHGKGAANYIEVSSPDRTYAGSHKISVPYSTYKAVTVGGTVCAQVHPGSLGMPWENVRPCEPGTVGNGDWSTTQTDEKPLPHQANVETNHAAIALSPGSISPVGQITPPAAPQPGLTAHEPDNTVEPHPGQPIQIHPQPKLSDSGMGSAQPRGHADTMQANGHGVYRCTDPQGNTTYGDMPCPSNDQAQVMPAVAAPSYSGHSYRGEGLPTEADQIRRSTSTRPRTKMSPNANQCMAKHFREWMQSNASNSSPEEKLAKLNEFRDACAMMYPTQ